jgi:hypothetical protein
MLFLVSLKITKDNFGLALGKAYAFLMEKNS